jgi:hypothetical protein
MERVRRRVMDPKVNRLIVAFLKAGILSEEQFLRSDAGTPQGGILSPLLANIALSVIEERYERHVSQRRIAPTRRDAAPPERRAQGARHTDRRLGHTIVFPILQRPLLTDPLCVVRVIRSEVRVRRRARPERDPRRGSRRDGVSHRGRRAWTPT